MLRIIEIKVNFKNYMGYILFDNCKYTHYDNDMHKKTQND
jgi:hypothetical protein